MNKSSSKDIEKAIKIFEDRIVDYTNAIKKTNDKIYIARSKGRIESLDYAIAILKRLNES